MREQITSPLRINPFVGRLTAVCAFVVALELGFGSFAQAGVPPLALGQKLWMARYNGPGDYEDEAHAVAVSPDGGMVFVTGSSDGIGTGFDFATVAYDATTGTQRWVARYDGMNATALGVSPDGASVFVTGYSYESTANDYATVAYDADTGSEKWAALYDGPASANDYANALGVSPDGGMVFVTGYSDGADWDYATVAYDAATGSEMWVARYNGPFENDDIAVAVRVSPNGGAVFVTGHSAGSDYPEDDYATVAYEAVTGTELWVARYNGPANDDDDALALGVSPTGDAVFVTGQSSNSSPTFYDYATVAYDAVGGTQRWVAWYNGPKSDYDAAYAMGISPDGATLFVTGSSEGLSSQDFGVDYDYSTVAYDSSSGARKWVARYNGPADDYDQAYSLAVSPEGGTVFVTGVSTGANGQPNYATVAYDSATGHQAALSTLSRGRGSALALSPDGSELFVTGWTTPYRKADYGTIAYLLSP